MEAVVPYFVIRCVTSLASFTFLASRTLDASELRVFSINRIKLQLYFAFKMSV